MDDLIFYEIAMEKRDDDAYIVTPSEMLNILNEMV